VSNRGVLQPNGLFARFSDIVDHFTHVNLTEHELFEVYYDEFGRETANGKVQRAKENPGRFDDEIDTIRFVHGPLEADRTREFLSRTSTDWVEPLPSGFRDADGKDTFDVAAEIAAYESYIPTFTEENDDEFHMRDRYLKTIEQLKLKQLEQTNGSQSD